jgi:hypothetical protein
MSKFNTVGHGCVAISTKKQVWNFVLTCVTARMRHLFEPKYIAEAWRSNEFFTTVGTGL